MNGQIPKNNISISTPVLFFIGLSAGLISAVFPRLMTLLVASENVVILTLFNPGFLIAAGVFALIVGVVMVWFYMGSSENTRNLFMAALAIPAVLSGGINMTSASTAGQQKMSTLSEQNIKLTEQLQNSSDIPDGPSLKLSLQGAPTYPADTIIGIFQVTSAHAANVHLAGGSNLNPSVSYQIKGQSRDYVIMFASSKNRVEMQNQLEQLQKQQIPNVEIATSGDTFVIYQNQPKSKSEAVLGAIELKKKFSEISPQILKLE